MKVFCYFFVCLISTLSWSDVNSAPCLLDRYETPLVTPSRRISRTSSVLESPAKETSNVSPNTELTIAEYVTDLVAGGNEANTAVDSSMNLKEVNPTVDSPTSLREVYPILYSSTAPNEVNPILYSSTAPEEVNPTLDSSIAPKEVNLILDSSTAPREVNPILYSSTAPNEVNPILDSSTAPREVNPTDDSSTAPNEVNPTDNSSTTTKEMNPFEISKETNPTIELASEVPESVATTTTTTESPIKKAAKALAESFHEMSRRLNQTFSPSTTRNSRSGILRLAGSNEVSDYMGIRIPPPMNFDNIRKAFKQLPTLPTLPTLPSLIKPTPPMHAIGLSGVLTDGSLVDLARGR